MKQLTELPEMGVGIIYTPAIAEIEFPKGLIDTLEVEPQTLCIRNAQNTLKAPKSVFQSIKDLPYNKLVHSIGAPVGGTLPPDDEQIHLINYAANLFSSPWVSEHLSFNAITEFNTGFFLPPCQTEEGLEIVIKNIRELQSRIDQPLVIETGVNYLRPNSIEMNDGEFVSALSKATGCGILLDIHNLFANQLNGRQSIEDFLHSIPLEQVIEIHIAGGNELNNLWLDSHSGPIDKRLIALTREILPSLPNLKAINYEIFDSYIPVVGDQLIISEMENVRDLWEGRKQTYVIPEEYRMPISVKKIQEFNGNFNPKDWEYFLGHSAIDHAVENQLFQLDDRTALYQKLIKDFRGSMVVKIFKLTTKYMSLVLGMEIFLAILNDFWQKYPPELLSHKEAQNFAEYLEKKDYKLPWLDRLLKYEVAILETLLDETTRVVYFDADPMPMLNALTKGKLPEMIGTIGDYEIEITPEEQKMQWVEL